MLSSDRAALRTAALLSAGDAPGEAEGGPLAPKQGTTHAQGGTRRIGGGDDDVCGAGCRSGVASRSGRLLGCSGDQDRRRPHGPVRGFPRWSAAGKFTRRSFQTLVLHVPGIPAPTFASLANLRFPPKQTLSAVLYAPVQPAQQLRRRGRHLMFLGGHLPLRAKRFTLVALALSA